MPDRILSIVEPHTAGCPTDPSVKWTHLKPSHISKEYGERYNDSLSHGTIKRILKKLGYVKRRPSKNLAIGKSPFRQQQFKIIFYFAFLFSEMEENPILSMDTKKKEQLGDFKRNGSMYCQKAPSTYTQDYCHLSKGKVVPHGLYDLKRNEGYVSIGTNYETADFLIDNLIWWWANYGIHHYPDATHLLLFCDAGGANSYRHHAFKKELVRLAAYIELKIVVVHYPPYCSKWNPIEHRLFSQMHLQADGAIFLEYVQVKQIFEKTTTKTGLKVFVRINKTIYQKGRKTCKSKVDYNKVLTHPELPQFNYMVVP